MRCTLPMARSLLLRTFQPTSNRSTQDYRPVQKRIEKIVDHTSRQNTAVLPCISTPTKISRLRILLLSRLYSTQRQILQPQATWPRRIQASLLPTLELYGHRRQDQSTSRACHTDRTLRIGDNCSRQSSFHLLPIPIPLWAPQCHHSSAMMSSPLFLRLNWTLMVKLDSPTNHCRSPQRPILTRPPLLVLMDQELQHLPSNSSRTRLLRSRSRLHCMDNTCKRQGRYWSARIISCGRSWAHTRKDTASCKQSQLFRYWNTCIQAAVLWGRRWGAKTTSFVVLSEQMLRNLLFEKRTCLWFEDQGMHRTIEYNLNTTAAYQSIQCSVPVRYPWHSSTFDWLMVLAKTTMFQNSLTQRLDRYGAAMIEEGRDSWSDSSDLICSSTAGLISRGCLERERRHHADTAAILQCLGGTHSGMRPGSTASLYCFMMHRRRNFRSRAVTSSNPASLWQYQGPTQAGGRRQSNYISYVARTVASSIETGNHCVFFPFLARKAKKYVHGLTFWFEPFVLVLRIMQLAVIDLCLR